MNLNQKKDKAKEEIPQFTGRNVPISEIAKAMHKDPKFIRFGIQMGVLKFGVAMKIEGKCNYSYYCSDRKVWEEIGYFNPIPDEKSTDK